MSKQVKAKFLGNRDRDHHLRDTSIGTTYTGTMGEEGSKDVHGFYVICDDEFTYTDDLGDLVVTRLSFGWELVED